MINPQILGNKIKNLREEASMSQDELAEKVGIGRVAVSQIENGGRGVDFLELAKIADIFKVRTDYFLIEDEVPEPEGVVIHHFNPEKLKNVLLYILERCAGKPNVGETVLYKLLYFIDFDFFELNKRSVTGLNYIHMKFGPVPVSSQYISVIEGMKDAEQLKIINQNYYGLRIKRYINLIPYPIGSLDPNEIKTIDSVINSLSDLSANKIEDYVHNDAPWHLTKDKEIISYDLVSEREAPYAKSDCDWKKFRSIGGKDILNEIGSISQDDYNYYENL